MPKIAIITIGWVKFALPPKVDAAKLLAALSQAEPVKSSGYGKDEVWFPAPVTEHDLTDLNLAYIDSRQMRPSAPKDDDEGPLRLQA